MGKIKDYFGTEVKDMDTVVFSTATGEMGSGIYFNNRIVTLKNDNTITHKNIRQICDMVIIESERLGKTYQYLLYANSKEFKSDTKEITVNELEAGGVYETKSGIQYIYMGDYWRIGSNSTNIYKVKAESYRKMFFKLGKEKYTKDMTLSQLIEQSMLNCSNGLLSMLDIFKFSTPKLSKYVTKIPEQEIKDFINNGKIGIFDKKLNELVLLDTYYNRQKVNDIGDKVGYWFPAYKNNIEHVDKKSFAPSDIQKKQFATICDKIEKYEIKDIIVVK